MKDLTLSEIWIYPVKSLAGIRLNASRVLEKGLPHDRRWMLVDENDRFITQRAVPQMALFSLALTGDTITISHRVREPKRSVSFRAQDPPLGQAFSATIWDDEVEVIEVSGALSNWFSEHLLRTVRLVHFPEKNERPVNPVYAKDGEQVSLADAYPFMMIGQGSLDDLNRKLGAPMPIKRFRPNFVFTGGAPFEEENWTVFSIGQNRFRRVKSCDRCVLTTIDPETAEKGREPLETLSTYRKRENRIYFGENLVALDQGSVSVGDKIAVHADEI